MIVITGCNGFTGKYLIEHIKKESPASVLTGIDLHETASNNEVNQYFSTSRFKVFSDFLLSVPESIKIFHLGGLTGKKSIAELIHGNVFWTAKYLELFASLKSPKIFINVGSSAEYGYQSAHSLNENLTPAPVNHYGISKYLQSEIALSFKRLTDLNIISTRTFNLVGPGLSTDFVVGKIIHEALQIAAGKKDVLQMGRTDSTRDFIDVRDAVKLYFFLSDLRLDKGIINIASGRSSSINEIVGTINYILGINPTIKSEYRSDNRSDIDVQVADIKLLNSLATGIDTRSLEISLTDMIDYERSK